MVIEIESWIHNNNVNWHQLSSGLAADLSTFKLTQHGMCTHSIDGKKNTFFSVFVF